MEETNVEVFPAIFKFEQSQMNESGVIVSVGEKHLEIEVARELPLCTLELVLVCGLVW